MRKLIIFLSIVLSVSLVRAQSNTDSLKMAGLNDLITSAFSSNIKFEPLEIQNGLNFRRRIR